MARVRVVIVTFNSGEVIAKCLDSLRNLVTAEDISVVVVDNGSSDQTVRLVTERSEWVTLIQDENHGFGAGNNRGALEGEEEFLLFLNPDTEVRTGAIRKMADFLDEKLHTGIVGPAILNAAGDRTLSSFRFLTPLFSIWIALGLQRFFPLNRIEGRTHILRYPPEVNSSVDRILGAAFMIKRDLFTQIGGFDERFFLYSEEEDLCRRVWEMGRSVVYLPGAEVVHSGGHSTETGSYLAVASSAWSHQYYLRKHYGRWGAGMSRWAWITALLLRWIVSIIRLGDRGVALRKGYYLAIKSLLISDFYDRQVRPSPRISVLP